MAGRAGVNNQLLLEMVEILYGKRGDQRQWAMRRGELVDVQQIIADMRKSLDDLKKSLQQVKADIDDINNTIAEIEQRLNQAEQKINELDSELSSLEVRIGNAETALTSIESSIASINTNLGTIGGDIGALQSAVTALTGRVSELEAGPASLSATTDLNTAVRNKNFQWSDTSTNTPVAGSWGRGFTIAASANDLTQIGIINATGQVYVRYLTGGTWSQWSDIVTIHAEPYALQSNPGATPFPAGAYTAIPFYTNGELSGGITLTSNKTFTVPSAGLYQFELEVRMNGGATSMPPVGTAIGLSIDTTTVPTALRAGFSTSGSVIATTILRLVCTERLAAGAQRVGYILNQGAGAYQVTSAVMKITRLSA